MPTAFDYGIGIPSGISVDLVELDPEDLLMTFDIEEPVEEDPSIGIDGEELTPDGPTFIFDDYISPYGSHSATI